MRELHEFEMEPEVRNWLDSLSDSDFKRVDEVAGMLAEHGPGLGGLGRIIWRGRYGSCAYACEGWLPG